MITRRNFIKSTAMTSLAIAALPGILRASPVRPNIGLQLYTLRDLVGLDLKGTLKKVAGIGYNWLELAGYADGKFYGLPPAELRKMVDDLGMKVISSHAGITPEESRQAIDAHSELGATYLVFPWVSMPEKPVRDDFSRLAKKLNDLGDACRKSGLKFGYHNHAFEFVKIEDTTGYDILMNDTEPANVCFESDLYWMVYAGVDPVHYFKKYPGRFKLWHVKDMEDTPEKGFAPVGTGSIDFSRIFAEKETAGMEYFFVEQDTCKDDPLKSVKISYKNLAKMAV
jgi:sugar phosphate isomerase/epimerase